MSRPTRPSHLHAGHQLVTLKQSEDRTHYRSLNLYMSSRQGTKKDVTDNGNKEYRRQNVIRGSSEILPSRNIPFSRSTIIMVKGSHTASQKNYYASLVVIVQQLTIYIVEVCNRQFIMFPTTKCFNLASNIKYSPRCLKLLKVSSLSSRDLQTVVVEISSFARWQCSLQ